MKKTRLILVSIKSILLLAGFLIFSSCSNFGSKPPGSEPVKRNCDTEYMKLSVREYSSCSEAILDIDSFLFDFENNENCHSCCKNARKIKEEFIEMNNFLENDASYARFLKDGEKKDEKFSSSSYETVRKTWKAVYSKEKGHRRNLALNKITPEMFLPYLAECAKQHCLDRWHRGGNIVTGWDFKASKLLGEIRVSSKNDGKYGYGTFHVDMVGSGPLGWRQGSADVNVNGSITLSSDGSLRFVEGTGYSFDNIIHLDRMD
jgi:hypothetical protein